eukprot:TRINITY_DN5554_c0_g1_i1.p1 TRINITY_DN5554_c0_g1~~TRINITY_DN5554_c0_g1_i1.p1  ORF type:complete len:292 (+),score=40.40 TRINITY_DN5554_c0_g1_i1:35-877(+)
MSADFPLDTFFLSLTGLQPADLHARVTQVMFALGVATFLFLQGSGQSAGYGKFTGQAFGKSLVVPSKLGWFAMESPNVFMAAYFYLYASSAPFEELANKVLVAMFVIHYVQRSMIYPLLQQSPAPQPIEITVMSWLFCMANSYIQLRPLYQFRAYTEEWLSNPCFIVGAVLFAVGFAINIQSDQILRDLRKHRKVDASGKGAYEIPRGGLFEYVSSANYFGELVEWTGFAIASWSFGGLTFVAFSFFNLAPRAVQNHKWYHDHFGDAYPKERKALIPFLW